MREREGRKEKKGREGGGRGEREGERKRGPRPVPCVGLAVLRCYNKNA